MAYKSAQVNVGSLLNPTEGLSRSLSNLSNTFGRQAAAEQSQLNREQDLAFRNAQEAARQDRLNRNEALSAKTRSENLALNAKTRKEDLAFRNAQEGRLKTSFGNKEQKRLGEIEFNRSAAKYNPNTAVYTPDSLDSNLRKELDRGKALISGVRDDFVNYASGDGSDKSLKETSAKYEKYLDSTQKLSHTAKLSALEKYEEGLKGTRDQLKTLDAKGKSDLIRRLSQEKFGHRLDAIDNDISTGRYLVRADKVKAFISQLPASVTDNVPFDKLYKTIQNQTGGTTAKSLLDAETARVRDVNVGNRLMFSKANSAINAKVRKSGKSTASWKSSDLKNALEGIEGIDIGVLDNSDVQLAAKDMLSQGKHPIAVYSAIKQSINKGSLADSFFNKESDPAAYNNFSALVDTFAAQLGGDSRRGSAGRLEPINLSVEVARDLDTIRRQGVRFKGDNVQLRSLIDPKILSDLQSYNLGKELIIPDRLPQPATNAAAAEAAPVRPLGYNTSTARIGRAIGGVIDDSVASVRSSNKANLDAFNASTDPVQIQAAKARASYVARNNREAVLAAEANNARMSEYITGGDSFGTNSKRLSILTSAGVPYALAEKAANRRSRLTDKEKGAINKALEK